MPGIFDITAYGAKAGTDSTAAIRAACDAAKAAAPAAVLIPSGRFTVSRTIFLDGANVTLQGQPGSCVAVDPYNPCDPFAVGLSRVNMAGQSIGPANFLQGSLGTGFRTNGSSWIQVQNHPFQFGAADPVYGWPCFDYWTGVQQLVIQAQFDRDPAGDWSPGDFLFGLGDAGTQYTSFPFACWVGPDRDTLIFTLRTADIAYGWGNADHRLQFSLAGLKRPYQLAIAPDLVAGTLQVYDMSSGKPVAIPGQFTPSWAASKPFAQGGLNFAANVQYPFMVGMRGRRGNFGGASTKLVLYGLRIEQGPIAAVDWNLHTASPRTIAFFPAFDPARVDQGRLIPVGTGPAQGDFGYWAYAFNAADAGMPTDGVRIEGLEIQCAPGKGAGVLVGTALDLHVTNCKIENGAQGIGGANIGENYKHTIRDCRLQGFDTSYYGFFTVTNLDELDSDGGGWDVFRVVGGSIGINGGFAKPAKHPRYLASLLCADNGGGNSNVENFTYDNEGSPQLGGFYVEQPAYGFGTFECHNCSLGQSSGGPAIVLQRESTADSTTWRKSEVTVVNLSFTGYSPAVLILGGPAGPTARYNRSPTGAYSDQFEW